MNKFYIEEFDPSSMTSNKSSSAVKSSTSVDIAKVKFEVYGEEMIDKVVKSSGNSGRVYLPPNWVGCHVKVVRID